MDNEHVNTQHTPENTNNSAPHPFDLDNLFYVSEIERPQDERIESFCKVLRDSAKTDKIGHAILIFECEVDGKARLGYIANVELQELRGKTGLLRAEELVMLQQLIFAEYGVPKLGIGAEVGLEYSRKLWAADAAKKEQESK